LKTLYKPGAEKEKTVKSVQLKEQDEFNQISDKMLYVIHGPLYFDYEWIFRQDPGLIKHILGEELPPENASATATKEQSQWIRREDPLTENAHYINRNPTNPNYPKMRFDNPTVPLPRNVEPNRYYPERSYAQIWKELYVSPEQAKSDKNGVAANARNASGFTNRIAQLAPEFGTWDTLTTAANTVLAGVRNDMVDAMYDWTTPGYYRYEMTVTTQTNASEQLTNRFTQLMRPVETGTIQDFTEPNLPTAYPAPLMFITPPMRGPTNSFMIHAWIPDLSSENSPSYRTFITIDSNGKKSLNRVAYVEHLYKMMQLIFKTIVLNAKNTRGATPSSTTMAADSNRICVKLMAIGYGNDDRNLKMVSDDDKKFIGDSFFYAVRDYSMFYEQNNVYVIVYYNEATQQDVKQRYNEYTSQREAVLLKTGLSATQTTTIDKNLKLNVFPVEDFFTLKFPIDKVQLQEKDLLYFVNYCSTPRAFIGNCGEWPENIEELIDNAILGFSAGSNQKLLESLANAHASIRALHTKRGIDLKMNQLAVNLNQWNEATTRPKELVSSQERIRDKYVKYNANDRVVQASEANNRPMNVNVSWWKGHDGDSNNAIPRNAYLSSFDEHVLILNNLLRAFHASAPHFEHLSFINSAENATMNCGPYTTDANVTAMTFENAVYAYVHAKKILTMLSKIKADNNQVDDQDMEHVSNALGALTVNMSWSMDAKFTTGACEGAFIPNSSLLHNPFICTQLLDINKWQYVDFDDIASREITGTYPLLDRLKKFVDSKIQESESSSQFASKNVDASSSGILVVSKQPSIGLLMKNIKIIFENLFQKNAPLKIDGKEMVLNNYAWPEERLYCKMRNDTKLASFKSGSGSGSGSGREKMIDFAVLRGLRSSSNANCIKFPLFVVQLMFTLFEGKLSEMTMADQASLSCASDETMLGENFKIVWEQMMHNLKAKEQNFTIANIFKRVGLNPVIQEYTYTAYFDAGSATVLINCINSATNPLLTTTNSERLKKINEEVSNDALQGNERFYDTPRFDLSRPNQLPIIQPNRPYNSIRALAKIAEIFSMVEMHGVAGVNVPDAKLVAVQENLAGLFSGYIPELIQPGNARIGWNAAIQTDSTMLYVNPIVMVNGNLQDITSYLTTMKPGDKILIETDTNANVRREIINSALTALRLFGRKIGRGGRSLGRAAIKQFYNAFYAAWKASAYVFALVKQVIRNIDLFISNDDYANLTYALNRLKVMLTNFYRAGTLPKAFVVAVYRGLKAVWEQRKANASNDLSNSLDNDPADILKESVNHKVEYAEDGTLIITLLPEEQAKDAAAMNAAVDVIEHDDEGNVILTMGASAAPTSAPTSAPTVKKWDVFKDAFNKSIEPNLQFEKAPDIPGQPVYDSSLAAGETAATAVETRATAKRAELDAANVQQVQRDEDQAQLDEAANIYNIRFEKSQMWLVTAVPTKNAVFPIINIPVNHSRLRTSNLSNFSGEEIENETKLKVQFQKFSKEEAM
jgi:hypothetical protein